MLEYEPQLRKCFDCKGHNHSTFLYVPDGVLIKGNPWADLKGAAIYKNGKNFDIEWEWADKKFDKQDLPFKDIRKILKFYQ